MRRRRTVSSFASLAVSRIPAALVAALLAGTLLAAACTRPRPAPPAPPPSPGADQTGPTAPPPSKWIDASGSPFAVRGIVEGFYGAPWSQEKRLAAFDFMARVGMNTYVYAPKDDPYQRSQWRDLYPEAQLTRFRALLTRARQDGVDFVYSISPGLDVIYSSPADRQALAAKVNQLAGLGIHTIMLSLDDVPEKLGLADTALYKGNYALAQAELVSGRGRPARFLRRGEALGGRPP